MVGRAVVMGLAGLAQFSVEVQAQATVGPVFLGGEAQVVAAFEDSTTWIREQLWVETEFDSDGDGRRDRMHVAVVRPSQTQTDGLKVPVVYESSPYYSGVSGDRSFLWDVNQELGDAPPPRASQPPVQQQLRPFISNSHVDDWVPRGFAVVHSEAPGTGLSQGCPTVGGPTEALAPKAVVDWLNGRARGFTSADGDETIEASWSTGSVGMTGTSYNGTIPVAAATTGVAGLEAIIPVAPNTSYYRYYRSNGLVRHPGGWLGEDIDFLYDYINSGDPARRAYCNRTVRDGEMAAGRDRRTGDYNDFWANRDLQNELDGIQAATLMAHAFNDWNVVPEHSVRVLEALRANGVPTQAYFHQGGHGGPPPLSLMNRWFTRYLYDVDNGVEDDPQSWIVREGDDPSNPTPYPSYPHPEASIVELHPWGSDNGIGLLSTEAPVDAGVETLIDDHNFDGMTLSRAEWTEHRLLYATHGLTAPLHLSGTAEVTVRVAANAPAANLSVWLVSLPWTEGPNGRGGVVTRGWADPQNHSSMTDGEPLVPGQFYDVTFDLQPDDQVIPAGQRLALVVFSTDRDFTLWPDPGTELKIELAGTTLGLPVVGGAEAVRRALKPPVGPH